jgi:hypothetical protein
MVTFGLGFPFFPSQQMYHASGYVGGRFIPLLLEFKALKYVYKPIL